jgi:hypothetical protein
MYGVGYTSCEHSCKPRFQHWPRTLLISIARRLVISTLIARAVFKPHAKEGVTTNFSLYVHVVHLLPMQCYMNNMCEAIVLSSVT